MNKQYRTCSRCGANLDPGEKCDCQKVTSFDVTHYGKLVDDYETTVSGNHIRQKIYFYRDDYYMETWCNGIRYLFTVLV